jgi:phosphatidylglycerol---prolipoprotein diacylglyceryl transferase
MFYNNINPVLLEIGPFEIRYYGLFFVLGVLFTYWLLGKLLKERNIGIGHDDFPSFMFYLLLGVLIGSRLFSVLSELPYYLGKPIAIFMWWQGGMAFHGGLIGAVVAALIFCKSRRISFYKIADLVMIPVCLALALGRVGNYTNGEFYGKIASVPWAVQFQGVEGFRHPVQIYEAIAMVAIFGLLWWLKGKKLPDGTIFWSFIMAYGLLRFWLEFYKDLPPLLFGLTWGQLFCLPMILLGGIMLLFRKKINRSNAPELQEAKQ